MLIFVKMTKERKVDNDPMKAKKTKQAKDESAAAAHTGLSSIFNNLRFITLLGTVVLAGLFLATGVLGWGVSFGQQAQQVTATYSHSVAGGQLTVTLAETGVTGWKVIEVADKAACDAAASTDFAGSGLVLDDATASQSATITFEENTDYCFWPQRDTDNTRIIYSYVPASFIQKINPVNLEYIDQTEYRHEVAGGQLTVTLVQGGVQGWQVIEVADNTACVRSSFETVQKVVDSSDASNSVSLTYEAGTNYCFWPQRDTDYIKVVLSYVSAEYITTSAAGGSTVSQPQQPSTPVEPEETGSETGGNEGGDTQPDLVITDVSQTEKGSDTIIKVATNRDVTIGAAVRLDQLSVSGCDQAAFADDSLLHSDAAIENGSFYITVTPEDHGQEFCFQVEAGDEVAYRVSPVVDLPPADTGDEQADEQADEQEEDESDDEAEQADEEDESDDEAEQAGEQRQSGGTTVDDETDNATLFFIIIIAAVGVGIMAVFAIIIGISNGGRSKKKF